MECVAEIADAPSADGGRSVALKQSEKVLCRRKSCHTPKWTLASIDAKAFGKASHGFLIGPSPIECMTGSHTSSRLGRNP